MERYIIAEFTQPKRTEKYCIRCLKEMNNWIFSSYFLLFEDPSENFHTKCNNSAMGKRGRLPYNAVP